MEVGRRLGLAETGDEKASLALSEVGWQEDVGVVLIRKKTWSVLLLAG